MTPYDTAIAGRCSVWRDGCDDGPGSGTDIAAASAAPIVPEDKANAVEEFRPSAHQCDWIDDSRFGPEMTISISPGYRLCRAMLLHVAGVCHQLIDLAITLNLPRIQGPIP